MYGCIKSVSIKYANWYFFLNTQFLLNPGADNYAIYNLLNGDIITVTTDLGNILELAEKGLKIGEIAKQTSSDANSIFTKLIVFKENKIGDFYPTRVYIEKYKKGIPAGLILPDIFPPEIYRCFIELPVECSLNCSFCGNPTLGYCWTCSKTKLLNKSVNLELFLKRILSMNLKALIFYGGDPFLNTELLVSLTGYCRNVGFKGNIFVITNGSLLDANLIPHLTKNKIQPIICIFNSQLFHINVKHQNRLLDFCNAAQRDGLHYSITIAYLMTATDNFSIEEYAKSLNPMTIMKALIFDNMEGNKRTRVISTVGNLITRANVEIFSHLIDHHPCLSGSIAISSNGDITPCPGLNSEILGNIDTPGILDRIFENGLIDKYWNLSLSHLNMCKDCEFRFGCLDCRGVELRLTGNIKGKVICGLKPSN